MTSHFNRYPPIGYYGLLGDLRSAALLSKTGSIDWMCLPRFDSPWVFGRLLDWDRGGYFEVRPEGEANCDRTYRTGSNAIETRWWSGSRRLRVVDFMPVMSPDVGGRPPSSVRLVRQLIAVAGTMSWRATFKPRFSYGRKKATLRRIGSGLLLAQHARERVVLQFPEEATLELQDGTAFISGRAAPGQRTVLLLHDGSAVARPARIEYRHADRWLHLTDDFWVAWLRRSGYHGRFIEQIRRAALALKLMQHEPTGAFVAAPTTSLPESVGGTLNWDYRYTWLRDSAILVHALWELGCPDEATAFMNWLNAVHERDPSEFRIVYRVDGDPRLGERQLDELDGYRGSRPVRVGNAAVSQVQLDVYGEVFETAFVAWRSWRRLPQTSRKTLLAIVDYVLDHWEQEDSGIWEARQRKRRYLYSQLMCWVALDRALSMDRSLRMGTRRRAAVRRTRARIKEEIEARGYDRKVGAFTQALDDPTLDASALHVVLTGFLPPEDPRVMSTVDVIQSRLSRDGLVYRYIPEQSEFGQPEGAFLICTAWMIRALSMLGRSADAESLFSRLTETANDLGLFAEEFDPHDHAMLGNFPQALSHLAVIRAALELEGRLPAATAPRRGRRAAGRRRVAGTRVVD
ncbi:MAG TPA: glycoside hydrolase family 15 protein [Candidatus Limnocylindrales bacterium]|nr:glycoside hydrolase family 15 protein [Candidatus Limnocylindrales bacterium]